MASRRPREQDADRLAKQSNNEAERFGIVPAERPLAQWDNDLGTPVDPREPDYEAHGTARPREEPLPFRNLKGG